MRRSEPGFDSMASQSSSPAQGDAITYAHDDTGCFMQAEPSKRQSEHLLVVRIHKQLQAVASVIPVQSQVDRIATGHAVLVELLIPLAGIQLDPGVVAAVRANDALADVFDHGDLLGPLGRLSP